MYWRDLEHMEGLNYGSPIEDTKMVEKDQAVIVGDDGFMSFWDLRTGKIVYKC